MYNLLEAVRLIALLVTPFMPDTGAKILAILGLTTRPVLEGHDAWGGLQPGTTHRKGRAALPADRSE